MRFYCPTCLGYRDVEFGDRPGADACWDCGTAITADPPVRPGPGHGGHRLAVRLHCGCEPCREKLEAHRAVGRVRQRARERRFPPPRPTSYMRMHNYLRRTAGRAALYRCIECLGVAAQWAYQGCPDGDRREYPFWSPWCPHPLHYAPMCASCHSRLDRAAS